MKIQRLWKPELFLDNQIPTWLGYLIFLLNTLQSVSLQFKITLLFSTKSETSDAIIGLSNFFSGITAFSPVNETVRICLLIIAILIYILIILFIPVFLYFPRKKNRIATLPVSLLHAWMLFRKVVHFVLAMPLCNFFFGIIINQVNFEEQSYIIVLIFGLIVMIVSLLNTIMEIFLSIPLKSADILSRSNNKPLLLELTQRSLLSLFLILLSGKTQISTILQGFLVFFSLAISSVNLSMSIKYCPFYHSKIQKSYVMSQAVVFSFAFSAFLSWISSQFQPFQISNFIFISMLLLIPSIKSAAGIYHIYVEKQRDIISVQSNPQNDEYFSKLLYKLSKLSQNNFLQDPEDKILDLKKFQSRLLFSIFSFKHSQVSEKKNDFKTYLTSLAQKNTTSIKIKLIISHLQLTFYNDIFSSYLLAQNILGSDDASFSEKNAALCIIYKIKIIPDHGKDDSETKLINYLKSIENYEKFMLNISDHITLQKSFYLKLMEPQPCLQRVLQFSKTVQKSLKIIENEWSKFSDDILEKSPKMIKFYGFFLISLRFGQEKGIELLKKHNNILIRRKNHEINIENITKAILHPRTVIIKINLSRHKFGEVLKIYPSITKLLGYNNSELIGKDIQSFFPTSFDLNFHDHIRTNIFENTEISFQSVKINTFLRHKDGYALPVQNFIMLNPVFDVEFTALALFTPLPKEPGKEFLIYDSNGELEIVTFHIQKFQNHLRASNLSGFFPTYKEVGTNPEVENRLVEYMPIKTGLNSGMTFKLQLTHGSLNKSGYVVEATKSMWEKNDFDEEIIDGYETINGFDYQDLKEGDVDELLSKNDFKVKNFPMKKRHLTTGSGYQQIDNYLSKNLYDELDESDLVNIEAETKTFDERQSVVSARSDKVYKKLKFILDEMIVKLNFYKFKGKKVLFGTIVFFLVMFLVAISDSYSNSTVTVDEVLKHIQLIKALYGRTATLGDVMRNCYVDRLYKLYYNLTLPGPKAIQISNANQAVVRTSYMIKFQAETKFIVDTLRDTSLKNYFYQEEIRVFYDNFTNVPDTEAYTLKDSFQSYDMLIAASISYYSKIKTQNNTETQYLESYITTLAMNDLWIKSREYPILVQNSMQSILSDINFSTQALYYACLACAIVYLITVLITLNNFYHQNLNFLVILINNDSTETVGLTLYLSEFHKRIREEIGKKYFTQNEAFIAKEEKAAWKNGYRKPFFFKFWTARLLVMIVLIIPASILLWLSYIFPNETYDIASNQVSSIRKLNEIGLAAVELISDASLYDYMRHIKTKNRSPAEVYPEEIEKLDLIVSATRGMSNELQEILTLNLCPYYETFPSRPNCAVLSQGQGLKGLKASIYWLKQFFVNYKLWSDSLPDDQLKPSTLNGFSLRLDSVFLISNAINPAVKNFTQMLTNSLLLEMNSRVDRMTIIFATSLIVAVAMITAAYIWIFKVMAREREYLAKTLMVLPLEFMATNKHLKSYLTSESKEFCSMIRELEVKRKTIQKKLNY